MTLNHGENGVACGILEKGTFAIVIDAYHVAEELAAPKIIIKGGGKVEVKNILKNKIYP